MSVRIRVDDFPFTKLDEWDTGRHSLEKFREFDACLSKRYLLGIIPWNCQMRGIKGVLEYNKVEPGLHGFWHSEARQNEFEGHSIQEIEGYLCSGRQIVREVYSDLWGDASVYMPPHNAVDINTVIACRRAGFTHITGGPETDPFIPSVMRHHAITYLPSMPPICYGRSDELVQRGAVPALRELSEQGVDVTLGLHWTWESNIGLASLRWLLAQLGDVVVDF